jgi:hypothetical protein
LLAFAYFAVGQAAANRNGAQTAADAAALAAAQDTRDQLAGRWLQDFRDPTKWQDAFDGNVTVAVSCWRAYQLASQNEAHVESCEPAGALGYRVDVETDAPVGDSIVPGTENQHARAHATAVIEPLCTFEPLGEGAEPDELPQLTCWDKDEGKGKPWNLDPDTPADLLPEPQDLFDVHLAD